MSRFFLFVTHCMLEERTACAAEGLEAHIEGICGVILGKRQMAVI